jgi:hypothetical protein
MPPEKEDRMVHLARLALEVLDAQQRYFKSRVREDLFQSKYLEGRLRYACEYCLREAAERYAGKSQDARR